jgi:hypothetical protein
LLRMKFIVLQNVTIRFQGGARSSRFFLLEQLWSSSRMVRNS